jgi:transcriptional regulator with XRE-family HTH domain
VKVRNQKYLSAFGHNLKRLIEAKKKTPEEIAAHGYIETKQVYRVINGEHSTTISVVYAIAKGLGVKPKQLFDFEFNDDD